MKLRLFLATLLALCGVALAASGLRLAGSLLLVAFHQSLDAG